MARSHFRALFLTGSPFGSRKSLESSDIWDKSFLQWEMRVIGPNAFHGHWPQLEVEPAERRTFWAN